MKRMAGLVFTPEFMLKAFLAGVGFFWGLSQIQEQIRVSAAVTNANLTNLQERMLRVERFIDERMARP